MATKEELQAQIADMDAALTEKDQLIGELIKERDDLKAVNDMLQQEIEQLTAKAPQKAFVQTKDWQAMRFINGGITYKFSFPAVVYKDHKITPAQVVNDEAMQNELLAKGSKFFKPE